MSSEVVCNDLRRLDDVIEDDTMPSSPALLPFLTEFGSVVGRFASGVTRCCFRVPLRLLTSAIKSTSAPGAL